MNGMNESKRSMPFISFSDLVHKITVSLQNQQYSILAKSDLYDISNLIDCQFAHPKTLYHGPHLQWYYYVQLPTVTEGNAKENI